MVADLWAQSRKSTKDVEISVLMEGDAAGGVTPELRATATVADVSSVTGAAATWTSNQ